MKSLLFFPLPGEIEDTEKDIDAIGTYVEENYTPADTQTTADANAAIADTGIANTAEEYDDAVAAIPRKLPMLLKTPRTRQMSLQPKSKRTQRTPKIFRESKISITHC